MAQITTSTVDWHGTAGDPDEPEIEQQRAKINTECLFRDGSVTATGALNMGSQKITSLATPTADTDAATKGYVDGVVEGLDFKGHAIARTTAAVGSAGGATWTLAAGVFTNDANGALDAQDGQTMTAGQVLAIMDGIDVGAGTVQTYNGLVTVTTVGDGSTAAVLTQLDSWATGDDVAMAYFQIDLGTLHEDTVWQTTNDVGSGVVGTDVIAFSVRSRVTPANIEIPLDILTGTALSGAWAKGYDGAGLPKVTRTAAAATEKYALTIPGFMLRGTASRGFKPTGLIAKYTVDTADATDVSFQVYKTTMGADNAARSTAILFGDVDGDYDAAHDTAAERGDDTTAPELHTATLTDAGTPAFMGTGEQLHVVVTVIDPGTSDVVLQGLSLVGSFALYD